MNILVMMMPIAIALGLASLIFFVWSLKNGQYEDMEGDGNRILWDDDIERKDPPDAGTGGGPGGSIPN